VGEGEWDMSESNIQKAILDYLQYQENGIKLWFVRSASGNISTDTGRRFKTGKKGCPDIVLCQHGCFIGLEVKTPKGRQSDAQVEAQKIIEACGGKYYVVRSVDDVIRILESEG